MKTQRDTILHLLKLTKAGPISRSHLAKATNLPKEAVDEALGIFFQTGLFDEYDGVIEASPSQRLRMAMTALALGADFERVCNSLSWKEFEGVTAHAFEANGYRVIRNFHFRDPGRRWEIDVLGLKQPIALCADCKHWKRGWRNAASASAVQAQIERTAALNEALPTYSRILGIESWTQTRLVPMVLSLVQGPCKFHNGVPVVPVLQIQDFINEVPLRSGYLLHFDKKLPPQTQKLAGLAQRDRDL
jgi:hypothetical protein